MASTQHPHNPLPFRSTYGSKPNNNSGNPALGFSTSTHVPHTARESARLERERAERERAALQAQQNTHQNGPQGQNAQQQGGTGTVSGFAALSDEQRDEVNEAFGLFDLDKDGVVDYHEFKVALKALGFDLAKGDLLALLVEHGMPRSADGSVVSQQPQHNQHQIQSQQHPSQQQQSNQSIPPSRLHLTLPAFQTIAAQLISQRDPRDEILRAFNLFDTEGKGMISLDDLRRVARELGEGLEEEELVAMIEEFDLEGKGGVGREEFVGICMG